MKVSYSLNGQKLDSDHMRVIVGSTHYTGLSPVVNTLQVKGRHGVVVDSLVPRLDAPELTLKVAAWGGDSDSRMARFRSLCLLTPGLTIGRTEETDDGLSRDMLTRAVCTSCEPDDEDERPFQDLRRMTAVFSLPDAFWRSDGYLRQELALTGGRLLRGEIKLPSGGYWTRWAGEANNSKSLMADFFTMWMGEPNNSPSILFDRLPAGWLSDAPIGDMIMRFPAVTSLTVRDPASGTSVTWSGTRENGKPWLYINVSERAAWTSASDSAWSGVGTDVSTNLDYEGEWLEIHPSISAGEYALNIKTTGVSSGSIVVRFRQSWQ